MKIFVMAGTRPEAIKVAPVVMELKKHKEHEIVLCNTGQHKEMIHQALKDFNIESDIELDVMQQNQTLSSLSSRLLINGKPPALPGDSQSLTFTEVAR